MEQETETIKPPESGENGNEAGVLHISYDAAKRARISLSIIFILMVLAFPSFTSEIFILHLFGVAVFVLSLLLFFECLATRQITLEPARIVKKRLFLGDSEIPARWAVLSPNQQTITFYHGSTANFRERITILRWMISDETADEILDYARKTYGTPLSRNNRSGSETTENRSTGGGKVNPLILEQFTLAANSYRTTIGFFVACGIFVVFVVATSDSFDGLAPSIPSFQLDLAAAALTLGAYLILRALAPVGGKSGNGSSTGHTVSSPAGRIFEKADGNSFTRALVANGVALLGLAVFLLSGNLLDFYLFLFIGILYFVEFYPRLSCWMHAAGIDAGQESAVLTAASPKRRSLQISLVLMGALAVASYGENRNYLYKNKKDCLDDWGSEQSCREAPASSGYYHTGYYFGPRYGTRGTGIGTHSAGMGMHSVGVGTISRGGFGSLGGFHASFGG
ncbi:MAG TPA: hypothetical protein VFG19_04515 [Geobacteraceae bacterium]|nr:hypothetical protein [Geobacteraceae bacterium]